MARAITESKRRLLPQLETQQSSHLHQVIFQSSCPGHLSCQGHHQCLMTAAEPPSAGAIHSSRMYLLQPKLKKRLVQRTKIVNKLSHKHSPTCQQEARSVKKA